MSQLSREMYAITESYYKFNQFLLASIGLWPFQKPYFSRIQKILSFGILLSFILVQLLIFATTEYSVNLLLKVLSFVFPTLFSTMKYCFFTIKVDRLKQMMQHMQTDWSLVRDRSEIDIIKRYTRYAKILTISFVVICYVGMLFIGVIQFLPKILDFVLPLNRSRPWQLLVMAEYFVNKEKYLYAMILHELMTFYIEINAVLGVGAMIMVYIIHACAMFKIASYRIENVVERSALEVSFLRKKHLLYGRMIHAIIIHQRAIEFIDYLQSLCHVAYGFLVIVGVCSLIINLVQFLQVTLTKNIDEMVVFALLILLHVNYMFVGSYGGQQIIDHGTNFFRASYNSMWYAAPLHTQKLLFSVMQKGMVNVNLTAAGLFIASFDCFATLMNTAVSYFTVIYSTR